MLPRKTCRNAANSMLLASRAAQSREEAQREEIPAAAAHKELAAVRSEQPCP